MGMQAWHILANAEAYSQKDIIFLENQPHFPVQRLLDRFGRTHFLKYIIAGLEAISAFGKSSLAKAHTHVKAVRP